MQRSGPTFSGDPRALKSSASCRCTGSSKPEASAQDQILVLCFSVYPHCFAWCLFFSPLCHTITTDIQRCLEKLHLFLNFKCHRHRSHTQIKLQEYAGFESFANTLNLISWTLGSAENVCFEIALVWIREHVVKNSAVGELAVKCEGLSRPDSQTPVLALTSRELW